MINNANQLQIVSEQQHFVFPDFLHNITKVPEGIFRAIVIHTYRIIASDMGRTVVDAQTRTALSKLQVLLLRMEMLWSECLQVSRSSAASRLRVPELHQAVLRYFYSLKQFLKAKEFSACGWDAVRAEVGQIMVFVTRYTDFLAIREMQNI
ncbi:hypothetical protein XELAEV_18043413mg [Xenopus laevis]|uniref:Uncharacterized protein n=1 Tax=Xenopus laevis TaxID=8355 RepID=A0A974BWW4_XENLA|nr:hypothetical protein XELAEV_18043413mg [Xenopus laevis]